MFRSSDVDVCISLFVWGFEWLSMMSFFSAWVVLCAVVMVLFVILLVLINGEVVDAVNTLSLSG